MPRLIDADALERKWQYVLDVKAEEKYSAAYTIFELLIEGLKKEPTIDPESLRPCGEWGTISINKENRTIFIECAECGATFTIPLFDFGLCYHYCPNCGAKMDEDEK